MLRKLSIVEQDILSLLQKTEPDMLLWREIKARLWPFHKTRYKDEKVFGVAMSNYLKRLDGKFLKHEGDYWGTLKSSPPKEKLQKSHETQPSKEFLLSIYKEVYSDFLNRRYIRACKGLSVLTKMHPRLKQIAAENKPFHTMTYEEFVETLGKVGYVLQSLA